MKKIRKPVVVVIITIIVTVLAVTYALTSRSSGSNFKRFEQETVFPVKTQTAQKTVLHGYISANGEIESQNSVSVFPDVAGKVISTKVMLGSVVKIGDIIAYVDPSAPGQFFKQSPVYAPISGSIISTPLKNGTTVSTSSEITQIGDISNLQVTAYIPERYVAVLKNGLKANIYLEAYPDVVFSASVSRVSPVVDAESRTKEIVLTFDRYDSRINAGMFGKVILYTEDYTGKVTAPENSIVSYDDSTYIYVVKDDSTVERRAVVLGHNVDGQVQIDGVDEGERIVIQGQTALSDGSSVRDITEVAK